MDSVCESDVWKTDVQIQRGPKDFQVHDSFLMLLFSTFMHLFVACCACRYLLANPRLVAKTWRGRLYFYSSGTIFNETTCKIRAWLEENPKANIVKLRKVRIYVFCVCVYVYVIFWSVCIRDFLGVCIRAFLGVYVFFWVYTCFFGCIRAFLGGCIRAFLGGCIRAFLGVCIRDFLGGCIRDFVSVYVIFGVFKRVMATITILDLS